MWHDRRRGIGYTPIRQPLDPQVARAHLSGAVTVGTYPVRADDHVRFAVVDVDATRPALAAAERDRHAADALARVVHETTLALQEALTATGLRPLQIDSGYKGRHLWCFLDRPEPAGRVRRLLHAALRPVLVDDRVHVEVFPKQDEVRPDGLGNLIKLPLGVHLRTGRRAAVLDEQGEPVADGLERVLTWPATSLPEVPSDAPLLPGSAEDEATAPAQAERLLRCCPMVRAVVERGRRERALSHDEVVVLNHSLGHLPDGVDLLNALYEEIPELPEAARLQSVLRGNPVSCSKVRKRLKNLKGVVPCECAFPERSGAYPHPLRHLDEHIDLDAMMARLAEARRTVRELEGEAGAALRKLPEQRYAVAGGAWICGPDGSVVFVPSDS